MSTRSLGLSEPVHAYLLEHGVREDAVLQALRAETADLPPAQAKMQIAPEQGAFLTMLAQLLGASRIIEVGVFTGYSSLCLARGIGGSGRVLACDVSKKWTDIARRYWADAGVDVLIDLVLAPATETLAAESVRASGTYDLAFIDADKTNYDAYYEHCLTLLRPGGLVVIDNVLWSGNVADAAVNDPETDALRALNAKIADDARVDLSMVPVADGLTLARKR